MKIHHCVQGTTEWLNLRAGIPTASEFDKIVTPRGKLSASAENYLFALLAERIMGHPRIEAVSTWMNRGSEMEAEAVSFYELQRDSETVPVGFVTNDEGTVGASPDRLVGDDGLLEIKVPSEAIHVSYLLKKSVDQAYYPQVQGQLWIAERQWVDILSYHPEMPPALIRVERNERFILLLRVAVREFSLRLEDYSEDLLHRGWIKAWPIPRAVEAAPEGMAEFLSEEDVEYANSLAGAAQAKPEPPAINIESLPASTKRPPISTDYGAAQGEAETDGVPTADGSGLTSPLGGRHSDNRNDKYRTFLLICAWLKHYDRSYDNQDYYEILLANGIHHANELNDLRTGRKIARELTSQILKEGDPPFAELARKAARGECPPKESQSSGPGPTAEPRQQAGPTPEVRAEIASPAINSDLANSKAEPEAYEVSVRQIVGALAAKCGGEEASRKAHDLDSGSTILTPVTIFPPVPPASFLRQQQEPGTEPVVSPEADAMQPRAQAPSGKDTEPSDADLELGIKEWIADYAGVTLAQVTAYVDYHLRGVKQEPERVITTLRVLQLLPAAKVKLTILAVENRPILQGFRQCLEP